MISKKSRKVVAALLIGATVCASGTFAYFNSKVDLNSITSDGTMEKLAITNGYINITGTIEGSNTVKASGWSYDTAKLSANEQSITLTQKDQSPDIVGFDNTATGVEDVEGLTRTKIGAALTGAVSQARPCDAIVLGDASQANGGGIKIVNSSNLTCKALVAFIDNDNAKAQLKAMGEAGWVMYVGKAGSTLNKIDLADYARRANGIKADGTSTTVDANALNDMLTSVNAALNGFADILAANKGELTLQIRFELPPKTDNLYQKKSSASDTTATTAFDLPSILNIVVTQENNPGWNNDGGSTLPTVNTTPNNGTDESGTVHPN